MRYVLPETHRVLYRGRWYEANPSRALRILPRTIDTLRERTLEEIIANHDRAACNPSVGTGLPVPWDQETQERRDDLLSCQGITHETVRTPTDPEETMVGEVSYLIYDDRGQWWKLVRETDCEEIER